MNPILYGPSIYYYLFTEKRPPPAYVTSRSSHRGWFPRCHWLAGVRTPDFGGWRGRPGVVPRISATPRNNARHGCHAE